MMLERLLNYWHSLEFFQPDWPVKEKEDIDLLKKELPWLRKNPNPDLQINYDIYFGCGIAYDLIVWMLDKLNLTEKDSPIERDQSKCCLCALKVNEDGIYIAGSFAVSSFIWALGAMVKANNFSIKLDIGDLEKLQNQIGASFSENEEPFSLEGLNFFAAQICNEIGMNPGLIRPSLWARRKAQKRKKDGTFPLLSPATELMSSFYTDDIARVMKNPSNHVKLYAESLCSDYPRTMIDTDITAMNQWLEADRFPRGTWPSVYSPSLMQQLAINLAISGQDIFSVNGPPGTGKTTLLKEIVASNIVERAALMAKYANPDDAFKQEEFSSPPDQYSLKYYRPDNALTAFGMLVASNNNAAVENISIELPKVAAKDRTGYFTNIEDLDKTYFSDIATALLKESAWGLVSARLGKSSNLQELRNKLWWADDANLQQYYKQQSPDLKAANWKTAKQNFFIAWEAVEKERIKIAEIQKQLKQYTQAVQLESAVLTEIKVLQKEVEKQICLQGEFEADLKKLEGTYLLYQQNTNTLKSGLSWHKRKLPGLFKKDLTSQELKKAKALCAETLISITRKRTNLHIQAGELEKASIQLRQKEKLLQETQAMKCQLESVLELGKKRFGSNYAGDEFFQNISSNDASQSACPWTDNFYDTLREELFYRALMLQKAFVLGSNGVKQNLMRLFAMWEDKFTLKDREMAYGCLLNTLFFVVPVISTTFASVRSFLDGIQPDDLGILVVDESGQATPQSALGAIWRTQKAIVVGDPLQVEPIMTTPIELYQRFADDNDLPSAYRIPELSVQMLADAQNPYGGAREINGHQLWLGCPLVVHRRCIEPMFSMSNQIAYSGRMFYKTASPKSETRFLLDKSVWFDVPGKEIGSKNHTVPGQIDLVASLLTKAVIQFGDLPDLYIITPFTSVRRSLKQKLRPLLKELLAEVDANDIDDWLKNNCGTIHTFQGKEANEVLLVLGCDAQQGMGAAHWVGQKPNIINVAVSRAKYRVGIIGS
ncbi:MAG: AAA domain-containing protein, partial [Fibromonadales bacterium]|nr:AAA domain-containing protein [Fibromonadales bacterium]